MERIQIDSFELYRKMTVGVKLYNNGFSADEVKKYISEGRLYKISHGSASVFLYDEIKYLQLVFPIENDVSDLKVILEKFKSRPVVCYVIHDGKSGAADFEELLRKLKFEQGKVIYEYALESVSEVATREPMKEYICDHVEEEFQYQEIVDLWTSYLPYMEIPHTSIEDVKNWEKKGQLLFIQDEDNSIKAACCFDGFLGKYTLHHIVVAEKWRGCGFAVDLLQEWINRAEQIKMRRGRSWIESTNIASQKSFEKIGFEKTSTVSCQYVYYGGR